jgi:hypothetical protein
MCNDNDTNSLDLIKNSNKTYAKECVVYILAKNLNEPIIDTIKRYNYIKKFAFILHDKDYSINENGEKEYKENPHYHIYLNFGRVSVSFDMVAKWFGQDVQYVNKVVCTGTMLEYLTHSNDSQQFKHQYDTSEVYANFEFFKPVEIEKKLDYFDFYNINYDDMRKFNKDRISTGRCCVYLDAELIKEPISGIFDLISPYVERGSSYNDIKELKVIVNCFFIYHDNDYRYVNCEKIFDKPHYHLYLDFGHNRVQLRDLAKILNVNIDCIKRLDRYSDVVSSIKHNLHCDEPERHQYSVNDINTDFIIFRYLNVNKL